MDCRIVSFYGIILMLLLSCKIINKSKNIYAPDVKPTCGKFYPYADQKDIVSQVSMITAEIIDRMSYDKDWEKFRNSSIYSFEELSVMNDSIIYNNYLEPDSLDRSILELEKELCYIHMISKDSTMWVSSNCYSLSRKREVEDFPAFQLNSYYLFRDKDYLLYRFVLGGREHDNYIFAYREGYFDFY